MAVKLEREMEDLRQQVRGLSKKVRSLVRREEPNGAVRARMERARALVDLAIEALTTGDLPAAGAAAEAARGPIALAVQHLSGAASSRPLRLKLAGSIAAMRRSRPVEGRRDTEVFRSNSSTFSVPDFLSFLQCQRKTGLMELDLPLERITLRIQDGDVVDAYSDNSPPEFRLGAILMRRGVIDQETLEAVLTRSAETGQRLGHALGAEELLSEAELAEALTEQTLYIFERLHRARAVPFTFCECEPDDEQPDVRLHLIELLLESARQVDEERRALEVDPLWSVDPDPDPDADADADPDPAPGRAEPSA